MVSGAASGLGMSVRLDRRMNRSKSLERVCASMKFLIGTSAFATASWALSCSLR
ncbi:hypothetical protein D9M71_843800 [compost metagenome]